MALVLQDRVKENSTSSGTGTVTLSGAYTGFRTFASCLTNGDTTYYCIHNLAPGYQSEWEVGLGTYSSNTLARTTVLSSSNAGSLVNFTAGSGGLEVFITYPAEKAIYEEGNGTTLINAGPITVIGSNVTSYTSFAAALGEMYANINNYAQLYVQNLNSGSEASADFAAYNSASNGESFFVDMGVSSPNANSVGYPILTPNSGYVISYGDGASNTSTLFLGSGDDDVKIFAGDFDANNTVATFGTDLSTTLRGSLNVATTLNVTGAATFSNTVTLNANPTLALQAATKQYVDDAVLTGFTVHAACRAASVSSLNTIYDNGTAGVGATLTADTNRAFNTLDGVSVTVGQRVLIKNQSTSAYNGIYTLTDNGSGSTPWVLTRATDFDQAGAGEIANNAYTYIQAGNTNAGSSWVLSQTAAITVGTTALPFDQFASSLVYSGGTNINISGQTISLDGTVAATNGGTGTNTVTTGDLLYGSGTNTWGKLGAGSQYRSLVMGPSTPTWGAVALDQSGAVSGTLPESYGGTNNSTYVTGNLLYASNTNTLAKLAPNTTTTKKFLSETGTGSAGQAPAWEQPAASDITGLAPSATTDTTNADNITSGTLNNARTTASSSNGASTIVARDASGNFSANTITANVTGNISGSAATLSTPRNFQISGGATAANVSFDGSAAVNLSVTAMNASVINTGVINNAYTTASSSNGASTIVARDASGNFTANNVSATNIIASGSFLTSLNASVINAGTLITSNGGTGLSSYTAGDIVYYASGTALSKLGIGTSGYFLSSSGTAPQWTQTLGVANGGTGLNSLTAGRIPFGAGTSAFGNSANLFWDNSNNRLGINTATPAVTASFIGTDAIQLPVGTTGQQPTGAAGMLRFNSSTTSFEGYNGTAWASVGGAAAFDAGTRMLFAQTSAPTGWTKQTTHNDKALRVVSGTASSGGTTAFSTVFTNQTPTITTSGLSVGATTLSTTQIPSHNHSGGFGGGSTVLSQFIACYNAAQTNTGNTGGGGSHTHALSGSATSSAITLNVAYVDVIIATKD